MNMIEFEAKIGDMVSVRDLEALRQELGLERLNVTLTADDRMIQFALPLPVSAVHEVDLVVAVYSAIYAAGGHDVAQLVIRR